VLWWRAPVWRYSAESEKRIDLRDPEAVFTAPPLRLIDHLRKNEGIEVPTWLA
jgi:hypothetical protein